MIDGEMITNHKLPTGWRWATPEEKGPYGLCKAICIGFERDLWVSLNEDLTFCAGRGEVSYQVYIAILRAVNLLPEQTELPDHLKAKGWVTGFDENGNPNVEWVPGEQP